MTKKAGYFYEIKTIRRQSCFTVSGSRGKNTSWNNPARQCEGKATDTAVQALEAPLYAIAGTTATAGYVLE